MDQLKRLDKAMLERIPREQRSYQALLDDLVAEWMKDPNAPAPKPNRDELTELVFSLKETRGPLWKIVENALKLHREQQPQS